MQCAERGDNIRAIPECITEFDQVNDSEDFISPESFENLRRMFANDPDYNIREWMLPNGEKIVACFFGDNLSSYFWHIPAEF